MNAVLAVLAVLDAVINTLWQAVLIAAAVWLALQFLPRIFSSQINAATRHAIWWATLVVVLILPVTPRILSAMRSHPAPVSASLPAPRTTALPSPETQPLIIRVTPDRKAKWPLDIFAIWAAILLRRLFQIARSYMFLRGMKQRATVSAIPLPVIPRRASLLVSNEVASPMAVGFLHPAVILPEALLSDLTDAEREHVLLHEAAHLAGYDDWSNLAMRLLGGALALHPIAIWILRRIEREREIACDDWVVARTGAARPYAESLAHLFELREAKRGEMLASGILGRHSRLGDRIEILLQRGRAFSPKTSPKGVATSAAALAILMLAGSIAPSIFLGDRYDIAAKAAGPVPEAQIMLMLRSLLEDRFHLVAIKRPEKCRPTC
jgi:beta-lactamase regulating signal transducer with metallopeptidase domain